MKKPTFTIALLALLAGLTAQSLVASNAPAAPIDLDSACGFAVLASSGITNTGPTSIFGDVGSAPNPSQPGFETVVLTGTNHYDDATTMAAMDDLVTAFNAGERRIPDATLPDELGSTTQTPGVYDSDSGDFFLNGTVTLDGGGDPDAVFIFQTSRGSATLITGMRSSVVLTNGTQAKNVFWVVRNFAILGANTRFVGSLLVKAGITLEAGTTLDGRAFSKNNKVHLNRNSIKNTDNCGIVTATPSVTETETPTLTATSSSTGTFSPTATPTSTDSPTPTDSPSATGTATPSFTLTSSGTPSSTRTPSSTGTATPSSTLTASGTPSSTRTLSSTGTATPSSTLTGSGTPSSTRTLSSTGTVSPSSTLTASATPSLTGTQSSTGTVSPSSSPSLTAMPSQTGTTTVSPSATRSTTSTLSATGTRSATSTFSATATRTASGTLNPSPMATATATRTQTVAVSPSMTVSPVSSATSVIEILAVTFPATPPPAPANSGSYIYPSPAKGATATIVYTMKEAGIVTIKIHNQTGRLVDTITESRLQGLQGFEVSTGKFASGAYYYVIYVQSSNNITVALAPRKFVIIH